MNTPHSLRSIRSFTVLTVLSLMSLFAGIKTDLDRYEPVPDDQVIPIEDFFRPMLIRSASMNNTGERLVALVSSNEDKTFLMVYDMATKKVTNLGGYGSMEVGDYYWINDTYLAYNIIKDKMINYGLFCVDTRDLSNNYPLIQGCAVRFLGGSDNHPDKPLVWLSRDSFNNGKDGGPVRLNTKIKQGVLVDWGSAAVDNSIAMDVRDANDAHIAQSLPEAKGGMVGGYFADKDGELQCAVVYNKGVPHLSRLVGKEWIQSPANLDDMDLISTGNSAEDVLISGVRQEGKPGPVHFMNILTGEKGAALTQDDNYDFIGYPYRDRITKDIIGLFADRGYPKVTWYTPSFRELQKKMEAIFPRQFVRIQGSDRAQNIFVVSTSSDVNPTVYHWLDTRTNSMGLIKNSRPWINPKRMAPMRLIKFNTRDGHVLDAYLTLPRGTSKTKPAPLVVLPHGGPWVKDSWGFNGEVQFLASRGYAVLQPNYRGSPGFDWMFPVSDRWDFVKMQHDVSDAAAQVIAGGYVDPDRVAIMGGSFGGYHAIAGAEETPCKYRCAVTIAGVFDWERMMKNLKRDRYDSPSFAYMMRFLGDANADADKYNAMSPIKHVKNIHIPVFVAHGRDDWIAELAESKALVSELEKYSIPHEVIFFRKEGHGTRNIDNTVNLYSRIEAFLAKNLAPRASR